MDDSMVETPDEIWARAFNRVRRDVDVPTVWLAMQAVRPLAVDGNRFVVVLPNDKRYLAVNLETAEYAIAIEEALREIVGRPLAFHVIEGQTLADWEVERARLIEPAAVNPAVAFSKAEPAPPPAAAAPPPQASAPQYSAPQYSAPQAAAPQYHAQPAAAAPQEQHFGDLISWDKLNETISQMQRSAPSLRYPHGQARFLMKAVRMISAGMDQFMDPRLSDPNQERQLSKCVERLASMLSLDPLFVSLELIRYRYSVGKE